MHSQFVYKFAKIDKRKIVEVKLTVSVVVSRRFRRGRGVKLHRKLRHFFSHRMTRMQKDLFDCRRGLDREWNLPHDFLSFSTSPCTHSRIHTFFTMRTFLWL